MHAGERMGGGESAGGEHDDGDRWAVEQTGTGGATWTKVEMDTRCLGRWG